MKKIVGILFISLIVLGSLSINPITKVNASPGLPGVSINGPSTGQAFESLHYIALPVNMHSPVTYSWHFGDGDVGYGQQVNHIYTQEGSYTISCTAVDAYGTTVSDTHPVSISAPDPLVVEINGPYSGETLDEICVSATVTGGYPPYTYEWDFGDGYQSTLENPCHRYETEGTYTLELTVTDQADTEVTDTDTVDIYDFITADLLVTISGPDTARKGELVTFTGTVSSTSDSDCVEYTLKVAVLSLNGLEIIYEEPGYICGGDAPDPYNCYWTATRNSLVTATVRWTDDEGSHFNTDSCFINVE